MTWGSSSSSKKKRNYGELWRAIEWGQFGNLIGFIVGLTGISAVHVLIWGAIITLIASVAGT